MLVQSSPVARAAAIFRLRSRRSAAADGFVVVAVMAS
jgi:hypothetical protein